MSCDFDRFRLRLCENAKVKFTIVRTGSSFYFSSLKTQSRPLYCAFFAYFEAAFSLPRVFTQPRLKADVPICDFIPTKVNEAETEPTPNREELHLRRIIVRRQAQLVSPRASSHNDSILEMINASSS